MDGIANSNEVNSTTKRKLGDSSRKAKYTKVAKAKKDKNAIILQTGDPPKDGMVKDNT